MSQIEVISERGAPLMVVTIGGSILPRNQISGAESREILPFCCHGMVSPWAFIAFWSPSRAKMWLEGLLLMLVVLCRALHGRVEITVAPASNGK